MWIFKLIRFKNLIIIAITQYLIQYQVIVPSLRMLDLNPALNDIHFAMLVFATMCVAAAGNVINDIFDVEIDAINRSETQVVSKNISVGTARIIYFSLIGIGLFLSILIAFQTERLGLIFIFPLAIIMLHYYSKSWKAKGGIGNVVVSAFVAFVTGILLIAEYDVFKNTNPMIHGIPVLKLLIGYIFFSFIANWLRELVKDMEDMEGDAHVNYQTYPIVFGIPLSKRFSAILILLLILGVGFWVLYFNAMFLRHPLGYAILLIIPVFLYILSKLKTATKNADYHFISSIIKVSMLFGLGYLLILNML